MSNMRLCDDFVDFGTDERMGPVDVDGISACDCELRIALAERRGRGGGTNAGGLETVALAAASPSDLRTLAILETSISWRARMMSSLDVKLKSGRGATRPGKTG